MSILKKIEAVGQNDGTPSKTVKIIKSGEIKQEE